MNLNVGQRVIAFVGIMTLLFSSVIVSHPKERTVTISVLSEDVDPNYELHVYSPNPRYLYNKKRLKLRKNKSKEKPLFYKIYTVDEQHSDRFSSTVNLYKGQVHKSQDLEGYIYRIEIKDVNGIVHQIDKKALQSMNDKIFITKPGEDIDFVFRKTDQGNYELDYAKLFENLSTKKQVGFFPDEKAAEFNPLVIVYSYDPELNDITKKEIQFISFSHCQSKHEVINVYTGPSSSDYITRIEVQEFDKDPYVIDQFIIDRINSKLKEVGDDEIVYFKLVRRSNDRGYSFVHQYGYRPEHHNSFDDELGMEGN